VNLERVGWVNGRAYYGGAGKVMVQTPTAPCQIAPTPAFGPHARSISLKYATARTAGFREFVAALEQAAEENDARTVHGRRLAESVDWDGTFRVSTFGETVWFDADGRHVEGPSSEWNACACLLQLMGVWISSRGSWGLKWRVLECKEMPLPVGEASACLFRDDFVVGGGSSPLFRD